MGRTGLGSLVLKETVLCYFLIVKGSAVVCGPQRYHYCLGHVLEEAKKVKNVCFGITYMDVTLPSSTVDKAVGCVCLTRSTDYEVDHSLR